MSSAALCLVGCGVRLPSPVIEAVTPDRGWNGEATVVDILGDHFLPRLALDAGRAGEADVDATFSAWLEGPDGGTGRFDLRGASAVDTETIQAIVEAGLEPGLYDVALEGPTGGIARLVEGFTVSDSRADRLAVDAPRLVWEVNGFAQLDIFLVDPNDERVFSDFEVEVLVSDSSANSVPVTFGAGGLEDARVLPDGGAITGHLGDDGFASLSLAVSTPGTYTVTASPSSTRTGVDDGSLKLSFEPGSDLSLAIRLPEQGFEAEAGIPFEMTLELTDQFGNPVPDVVATVPLRNACNTWVDIVEVQGVTPVAVQLDVATGAGCDEDAILVDEVSSIGGRSASFTVRPGPVDHLEVAVLPDPVRAGETLIATVVPVDAWGNVAAWTGTLTVSDSIGGLEVPFCNTQNDVTLCLARPTVAAADIVLQVVDDLGRSGASAPYTVLPGTEIASVEVTGPSPMEAGAPGVVTIAARDQWGNLMDGPGIGDPAYDLADDLGEALCTDLGFTPAGAAEMECVLFTARDGASWTATVGGVVGGSAPFEVHNGPVSTVALVVGPQVTAGVAFPLSLKASDAWGNPYVVQDLATIDLTDTTGTLSVGSADLRGDGTVGLLPAITRAGTTTITASQLGAPLGSSPPIHVSAAATSALAIDVGAPWAWVGVAVPIGVEAIDAFGNRTDFAGSATLTSTQTSTPDATVALTAGAGSVAYTWSDAALEEVLQAHALDGLTGEGAPLSIVRACDPAPTIALTFGGHSDAIACWDPAVGAASVVGSFVGSVPSGAPLVSYVLAAEGGPVASSQTPFVPLEIPTVGGHALSGLVIGGDLCATETDAPAWVGPDDGQPVGPIPLLPVTDRLDIGTATDVVIADVVDCSRDVAAYGTVKVRTTLGDLSGVTASGTGLSVTLDALGAGRVTLSSASAPTAGDATLHAWVDSGAAGGLGLVEVTQDPQLPVVWSQEPTGRTLASIPEVRLVFSEPMRSTSLVPANFSVLGPSAVSVTQVTLEPGDTEAVLTLDPPADGALGTWTLTASDALRDAAGNRLAGTWSGVRAPYLGTFGAVPSSGDVATCALLSPSAGLFRPDGDPGVGAETDAVTIAVSGAAGPAWWVWTVTRQATGVVRRREHAPASGATDVLLWDGRDQGGRVVDNGVYLVRVEPLDASGNLGEGCTVTATVDNRTGAHP